MESTCCFDEGVTQDLSGCGEAGGQVFEKVWKKILSSAVIRRHFCACRDHAGRVTAIVYAQISRALEYTASEAKRKARAIGKVRA